MQSQSQILNPEKIMKRAFEFSANGYMTSKCHKLLYLISLTLACLKWTPICRPLQLEGQQTKETVSCHPSVDLHQQLSPLLLVAIQQTSYSNPVSVTNVQ